MIHWYSHPSPRPKRRYRNSTPLVAHIARDLYFVVRLKQREIGRIFGLGQSSVSRIVSGQVWTERAPSKRDAA